MAIEILRRHPLTREEARMRIEDLAARIAGVLGGQYGWEGDRMLFESRTANGFIEVGDGDVLVYLNKSRMLPVSETWLREQIETQIDAHLS
jgi:putative polyhydroxyalkanoate system protein